MEGLISSRASRNIQSCWMHRRKYQRLPAAKLRRPAARGIRLGRPVLGSTLWRLNQLRTKVRSPLDLLSRIMDAYMNMLLSQSLKMVKDVSTTTLRKSVSSKLQRPGLKGREIDKRGMMLNFHVTEMLRRRSSSEVKRSPLHPAK